MYDNYYTKGYIVLDKNTYITKRTLTHNEMLGVFCGETRVVTVRGRTGGYPGFDVILYDENMNSIKTWTENGYLGDVLIASEYIYIAQYDNNVRKSFVSMYNLSGVSLRTSPKYDGSQYTTGGLWVDDGKLFFTNDGYEMQVLNAVTLSFIKGIIRSKKQLTKTFTINDNLIRSSGGNVGIEIYSISKGTLLRSDVNNRAFGVNAKELYIQKSSRKLFGYDNVYELVAVNVNFEVQRGTTDTMDNGDNAVFDYTKTLDCPTFFGINAFNKSYLTLYKDTGGELR